MSLAKVQKQLVRDLKRSPAKAGALGLLCVVALWFWAPLVSGWFGKPRPKSSKTPAQAATAAEVEPSDVTPASPPVAAAVQVPWRKIVGWREQDQRTQSALLTATESPPFVQKRKDLIDPGEIKIKDITSKNENPLDLTQLGLKLTSTMLGPKRRVAVINGRPYAEGDELEIGDALVFLVARVSDRGVVLQRNGRQFELIIEGKKKRS